MREYRADLHVHTCLSPCAELEMTPQGISERAAAVGLDLIAVCDHNSAANAGAVLRAAVDRGVCVIPGIEITTSEEVHLLGLFPDVERAENASDNVLDNLPGENEPGAFGMQVIADEQDYVVGYHKGLLAGASQLSLDETIGLIHRHGGLAVAAHVDREGFGIIGQLGFIPPEAALDAVEISRRCTEEAAAALIGETGMPVLRGSDAHRLEDIGTAFTRFYASSGDFAGLASALRRRDEAAIVM